MNAVHSAYMKAAEASSPTHKRSFAAEMAAPAMTATPTPRQRGGNSERNHRKSCKQCGGDLQI